jgi:hypothetical protein
MYNILIILINIIVLAVLIPWLAHSSLLKIGAVLSTTVLVNYQAIWRHIPEDSISISISISYSIYLFMLAVLTFTNIFLNICHPNTGPLCEI